MRMRLRMGLPGNSQDTSGCSENGKEPDLLTEAADWCR